MNIFDHCFERLTDDDKTVLKEYFAGYDYRGSSYTLLANYIWRNTYCLCWEVIDGYLFMAGADCMLLSNPRTSELISLHLPAI